MRRYTGVASSFRMAFSFGLQMSDNHPAEIPVAVKKPTEVRPRDGAVAGPDSAECLAEELLALDTASDEDFKAVVKALV